MKWEGNGRPERGGLKDYHRLYTLHSDRHGKPLGGWAQQWLDLTQHLKGSPHCWADHETEVARKE